MMRAGWAGLVLPLIVLVIPAQNLWAQDSNVQARRTLEEVVVTAQRREQSLMSVPLSIQALSGEQLKNVGVNDLTSLQFTTPGYLPDTNNGFVQVYVRGIGNAIFVGADPSVATFVDDVPQIYGVTSDNLVDVARVEVLKGAQGGLYGRNATGGVVNIITRQPSTEERTGEVLLSYGQRDTFRGAAYLNVPLSDRVAWSVSVQRDTHDSYVRNNAPSVPYSAENFPDGSFLGAPQQTADFFNAPQSPKKMYDQDFWAARTKLLFEATDNLSVTLAGSYSEKDDASSGQFFSSTPEFNQEALVGLFGSLGINAQLPDGFIQGASGKWTSSIGVENYSRIRDYSVSATAIWNGPGVDVTSITAYRNLSSATSGDNGTSTVAFIPFSVNFDRDYIYQEFRLASTFDGPLSLLGGATYLRNQVEGESDFYLLSYDIPAGSTYVDQTIDNWSIYGEVGYDLSDRFNLTVSGRYIREKNEADFTQPVRSSTDSVQSKFVPSVTLSYALDGGNAYLRWARGFKTGGVNILTAPAFYPRPSDGSIFGPETVDTYEMGWKQSLFDQRIQLTAAIFYNDYKDLQVDVRPRPQFPNITTAIVNADSARSWGVETGLNWQASNILTLGLNVGYLDAEYRDFSLAGSEVIMDFDLGGQRMPKSPKWQGSLTADLDKAINDNLRLVGNLLVSHTSNTVLKYSAFPGILPDAAGKSYWLVNARLGIKSADDRYGFYVVADNLFDEEYYIGADAGTFGNLLNYGKRRIVRGEFVYKF